MNASNNSKSAIILDECRIYRLELSALDWLNIMQEVLNYCKPCLQYVPNFEPIGSWLNVEGVYNTRTTEVSRVEFPQNIDEKTLCINPGGELEHEIRGELGKGFGVKYVKEKKFLLTREGQCLVWDLEYERVPQQNSGSFMGLSSGVQEKVSFCKFSLMDDKELLILFKNYPDIAWMTIMYLDVLIVKEVKESKKRFKDARRADKFLYAIQRRIH